MVRPATILVLLLAVPLLSAGGEDHFGELDERRAALLAALDFGGLPNSLAVAMLQDPFPQAHADAARALASEADPGRVQLIAQYAADPDPWARAYAMVGAGRIGPAARSVALGGLRDPVALVRQAAAWAACHGGDDAFDGVVRLLEGERDPTVLETAVANLWRFEGPSWESHAGRFAAHAGPGLRRAAAVSLARSERPARLVPLRRLAEDAEPVIRATAIAGLARGPIEPPDRERILAALADPDWRVRAAACEVLAARPEIPIPATAAGRIAAMWVVEPGQLAVAAVRAAASHSDVGDDSSLLALVQEAEPWPATEALRAVARRGSPQAATSAGEWIGSDQLWRRRAAAGVAPMLSSESSLAVASRARADREPAVRLAWLDALDAATAAGHGDALWAIVGGDPDGIVRARAVELLADSGQLADPKRALGLAASWAGDPVPDARAAALVAALRLADESLRGTVVERGLADPDRAVAAMVVQEARRLGAEASLPYREPRHGRQWYRDLLRWVEEARWLDVVTVRGTFRIRLELQETPITSREIWELADRGFYDGLTIHRVVPNFVVQGGDPRGDGWGGPGFVIPDEPTARPFDSWRVGIATSGPQTGGCQLFVTLLPADRLTGHYTNLGEVVAGREVVERLQVGDRILRVETASGREPPPPQPVLMGRLEWPELEALDGWQAERDGTVTDPAAIERLRAAEGGYRLVAILGTWCDDSRREVPRLQRVVEDVGGDRFELVLVGVDRTKRVTDPDVAAALPDLRVVDLVPTIVMLDDLGQELGRIVEVADRPIEQLLVEFMGALEGGP